MLDTAPSTLLSGDVVGLRDGQVAIVVYRLDAGDVLLLVGGELRAVSPEDLPQRPATCPGCGGAVFWWDAGHFVPWCLACIPPDSEWRTATLLEASDWAEQTGHLLPRWFVSWLAAQEHIGPGGWAMAQQSAFAGRVPSLVVAWYEKEGLL